jgi:hypothetical protein
VRTFVAALLFSLACSVSGQLCTPSDSPEQCWARYNPPSTDPVPDAAERVARTNTGVPGLTQPTGSSLHDFLSLFSAGLQTATVTESQNAVTLDWNVPFNIFGDDRIKVQAIFGEPVLSSDVKNAVQNNGAAISKLSDQLAETYDIQGSVTYAPQNRRFGRSIRAHEDVLNALVDSAIGDAEGRMLQALAGTQLTPGGPLGDKAGQFEALAKTEQKLAERHQQVVNAFVVMLNNQPQAYGSVVYRNRDQLAGPKEISAKFTYEAAGNSLNRFFRANADRCGAAASIRAQNGAAADSTTCVGKLVDFAARLGNDMQAGASNRLALSVEYKQMETNRFTIIDPVTADVDTPSVRSLVYTIAYGIPLATTMPGREGRFDLAVNYDDVSNDATRKDRLVGSVTYSQKLSDTLVLPLSLVYANHADYLPATGKRLGVHFGLNYKLPDRTP